MNFLQTCGFEVAGFQDPDDSDGEDYSWGLIRGHKRSEADPEDSDGDEDPWRSIQTHKGEVVLMRPEDAELIDPLLYPPYPAVSLAVAEPPMMVMPGLLGDEEISHILGLCSGRWKHSRVGIVNDDFKKGRESDVRTSSSCTLRRGETRIIRDIERRVSQLAGIDVRYLENLAPVRYMPGQQYRPHHDGSARPITIFIYMNDLEEDAGGETYFPVLDVKFIPRKGCAIMWKNPLDDNAGGGKDNEDTRLLHAGLPPFMGVKYGLNCFFNSKVQDDAPLPPPRVPSFSAPQSLSFSPVASPGTLQMPMANRAAWAAAQAPTARGALLPPRLETGWGGACVPFHGGASLAGPRRLQLRSN